MIPHAKALQLGVEAVEGYLPLDATLQERRILRERIGAMIADKIKELNAFEMVQGPTSGEWVLRCRLVIHFSGVAAKREVPAHE